VVRRFVRSRNFLNEEALAHWGLLSPTPSKKNNQPKSQPIFRILLRGLSDLSKATKLEILIILIVKLIEILTLLFPPMMQQSLAGQGLFIVKASP
jgi:hypothetical protein